MATYKEISGFNIKTLASDPSTLVEGDIWYNTTSNTLKVSPLVAAAWSSAGSLLSVTAQQGSSMWGKGTCPCRSNRNYCRRI